MIHDDAFGKSGRYTFSIQAIGDGTNYSDSEIATSDEYEFVCPDKKLETPTDVQWLPNGVIRHKTVPNAGGYSYYLYDQDLRRVGTTWNVKNYPLTSDEYMERDLSRYMKDILGRKPNVSEIYVTVKALTYNIEEYQNSIESIMSDPYDISSYKNVIKSSLDSIMDDFENGDISASEALDNFLQAIEDQDLTNTDIAASMQTSEDLVDAISALEAEYCNETGIDVSVNCSEEDSEYLNERGIDSNKVSVVGAALNSRENSDVDINFSKADDSLSVDELFYKNSVAVNISVEGVKDSEKLDIPIQIKMPVPVGVLPDRLVILHYHADNSIETIYPAVLFEDDEAYVSFVLTSFSSFVFCNESQNDEFTPGDVNGDNKITALDNAYLARYLAKWSGYDDTTVNKNAADVNGDGKVTALDNAILARHLAKWTGYDTLPYGK